MAFFPLTWFVVMGRFQIESTSHFFGLVQVTQRAFNPHNFFLEAAGLQVLFHHSDIVSSSLLLI